MVNLGYQLSYQPTPFQCSITVVFETSPFLLLTSLMMIYASGKTVDTKDGFS